MTFYIIRTPNFLKWIYKRRIWSFSRNKKIIYLTFDDGPTPFLTDWILNILDKYNAKATFFCIGKNIDTYPDLFRKIIDNKHAIGNHTNNHLNGWKTTTNTYLKNVLKTEALISSYYKTNTTKLFRPPYGRVTHKQVKKITDIGYKIIMWDVLSADFDTAISENKCLNNVLKNTENGSIIVFHDSKKASEKLRYVLPKTLDYFTKKGFQFKSITL